MRILALNPPGIKTAITPKMAVPSFNRFMKTHFGLIGTTLSLISLNRPQLQAQAVGISSVATYANYGNGETTSTLDGNSTTFYNANLAVTGMTDTNGNTYTVSGLATSAVTRTDSTSTGEVNASAAWYMGNAQSCSTSDPSLLYTTYNSGSVGSLLLGNDLAKGEDNVFVNSSSSGIQDNVERLDFLYNGTTGVSSTNLAIGVFELGTGDSFSVAVITGVDSNGNPTSYGGFVTVAATAFTGSGLLDSANANPGALNGSNGDPTEYLVRYDSSTSLATGNVTSDSATVSQNIEGVVMTLASLGITSGTTVYGYSLMGGDVTPGTNLSTLTNWSNTSVYKTTTSDGSAFDGLDPAAVNGVMFSMQPVPEPSTYAEVFLVGAVAVYGWRRHRSKWV